MCTYMYWCVDDISNNLGNHMNSSAIWEIIALSHIIIRIVIARGEAESILLAREFM